MYQPDAGFLGGWCFSRVADPADVIAWDNDNDGFCCLSWESAMTLGLAPKQADLLHTTVSYCERNLSTLLGHVLGWFIGLGWFPALVG